MTKDPKYHYVVNCTNDCHGPNGEAIHEMTDAAEDIGYAEFEKLVGRSTLAEAFPDYDWRRKPKDLTLKKDYAVSFHRSEWRDIPCVYMRHSGIEYIYTEDAKIPDEWTYQPKEDTDDLDEDPDLLNPGF